MSSVTFGVSGVTRVVIEIHGPTTVVGIYDEDGFRCSAGGEDVVFQLGHDESATASARQLMRVSDFLAAGRS